MNETNSQTPDLDTQNTAETPETVADATSSTETITEPVELDPWEQLEQEAARWKDTALRTAAEMENLRKRAAREREESIRYANGRLLEDLLPVIDNFEMGLQMASQDTSSMIFIGMDMVRKQLNDFLSNQGLTEIPTTGEFDANFHEAVSKEVSDAVPAGHIVRVVRRGFQIKDRLLRPASVIVAAEAESTEAQ